MASIAPAAQPALAADRTLAVAAAVLLALVVAAIARGLGSGNSPPPLVWAHLLSISGALALTPPLLWRSKGTPPHRSLGKLWAALMMAAATTSLFFNMGSTEPGSLGVFTLDFSPIHILSAFVLFGVPRTVQAARRHDVARHRTGIRSLVIGALLVAGAFTFPFGRLMGLWLTG
ncbi:hypothetical protein GCM10007973_19540 [Polymorphobacter multimanifer]|uniref:Putative membrane protein n=1 Tax=Polymorphobacter multimanifer TaxID=1070431 RepID=A0A841L7X7_9SPHN|nr:DUF2306 domain-containing protein [Polymorphobacter multimanifer]MBB6229109.1 putative membrane protein [Polymorphobacter multimanifer]GGI83114.1 hypothetical protein GCM10007973_19540 [Polymorphobacter multimanifer]